MSVYWSCVAHFFLFPINRRLQTSTGTFLPSQLFLSRKFGLTRNHYQDCGLVLNYFSKKAGGLELSQQQLEANLKEKSRLDLPPKLFFPTEGTPRRLNFLPAESKCLDREGTVKFFANHYIFENTILKKPLTECSFII
jgi:hypothetical protein